MFFYENAKGLYSSEVEMIASDITLISEAEYICRLEAAKQKRVQGIPAENTEDW